MALFFLMLDLTFRIFHAKEKAEAALYERTKSLGYRQAQDVIKEKRIKVTTITERKCLTLPEQI